MTRSIYLQANISATDDQQTHDPPIIITNHERGRPPVVICSSSDSSDDELPSVGFINVRTHNVMIGGSQG
jgi:hypothetical protein